MLPRSAAEGRWGKAGTPKNQPGLGVVIHEGAPLVGRRDEQVCAWEALRAAELGQGGRVVLVRGGEGFGKSHLLQWVCFRLREYGRHGVIHVRAREGQADRATLRALEEERVAVESAVFAPLRGEGVRRVRSPGQDARGRARAFIKWVIDYSAERPLVLIVDDVHHCPELWSLMDEVLNDEDSALCVVFSGSAAARFGSWNEVCETRRAHARVSCLDLELLSREDSLALLGGRLHLAEAEAERIVEEAGGHPGRLVAQLKERTLSYGYVPGVGGYVRAEDLSGAT